MRFFSILAFLPILALAAPLVKPEQVRTERSFGLDNRDLDERDASPSIALERLNGWMVGPLDQLSIIHKTLTRGFRGA